QPDRDRAGDGVKVTNEGDPSATATPHTDSVACRVDERSVGAEPHRLPEQRGHLSFLTGKAGRLHGPTKQVDGSVVGHGCSSVATRSTTASISAAEII